LHLSDGADSLVGAESFSFIRNTWHPGLEFLMRNDRVFAVLAVAVLTLACNAEESKLTAARARQLIPEAAGIPNADFKTLMTNPTPASVTSKSLSLVLMSLDAHGRARQTPAVGGEFRYLSPVPPRPGDLTKAISSSQRSGYVSFIQPQFITDCTCETTGDQAEGIVTFKSDLYAGRIPFIARLTKNGWAITEFHLPKYGTRVVRDDEGLWSQEDLPEM